MNIKLLKKIFIIIIFIILVCFIYFRYVNKSAVTFNNSQGIYQTNCGKYKNGNIKIGNQILFVNIADNDCKTKLGLSGSTGLNGEGMFFVLKKVGNYGFWMKNMNFPLDILWINDNFEIVGIEKSLLPSTYPNSFGQKYFAKYVLEVSAGYCDKNNIKVGDKIIFNLN